MFCLIEPIVTFEYFEVGGSRIIIIVYNIDSKIN